MNRPRPAHAQTARHGGLILRVYRLVLRARLQRRPGAACSNRRCARSPQPRVQHVDHCDLLGGLVVTMKLPRRTMVLALLVAALWPITSTAHAPVAQAAETASCARPAGVQRLLFSASQYPNVRAHFRAAVAEGWPRRLVLNRRGADERRDRLLRDVPTRDGFDRDE